MGVEDPQPTTESPRGTVAQDNRAKKRSGLEKTEYLYIGIMVLALVAVALTLGLVFGLKEDDKVVYAISTSAPSTLSPSATPSAAPTGVLDSLVESLPDSSRATLNTFGTPQWKALNWLSNHPSTTNMEKWKQTQLFALATFYYAFHGDHWFPSIRDNWMGYDFDECLWFSSAFGIMESGSFFFFEQISMQPPCNNKGEFQRLSLNNLQLSGFNATIPPEIALLTSLRAIELIQNNVGGTLSGLIPSELAQLVMLETINLASNDMTGTIPSELGLLTSLQVLNLGNNSLTGAIPQQVNALQTEHNLKTFITSGNNLSGQ